MFTILNGSVAGPIQAVRSVERAVDVLEALAGYDEPLTLGQLAARIRAPKSTTFNILRTLVRRRLLEVDAATRTYRLGLGLAELARAVREGRNLSSIARPYLERLSRTTQEAVFLSALEGNEIVFLDKIDSPQPIRYIARVGTRRPLHCTAAGKLALAWQPGARVDAYIAEVGLPRYTANTITTAKGLREELATIRRRGHAVSNGEFLPDLMGLAVPVLSPTGEFQAAVVLAGPAFRLRRQARALIALLKETADHIARDVARATEAPGPARRRLSLTTTSKGADR